MWETSQPDSSNVDEILSFYLCDHPGIANKDKLVLQVGTRNTDDYYPWFVAHFDPTLLGETK